MPDCPRTMLDFLLKIEKIRNQKQEINGKLRSIRKDRNDAHLMKPMIEEVKERTSKKLSEWDIGLLKGKELGKYYLLFSGTLLVAAVIFNFDIRRQPA